MTDPAAVFISSMNERRTGPTRPGAGLLLACMLALLAACGGSKNTCVPRDEPYLSARNEPALRVPAGLSQPTPNESLRIPAAGTRGTGVQRERCLDEPPSYFRASGTTARSPEEVVASWAQAWAGREADAVIALYSTGFVAPTDAAGSTAWLEQRYEQVATGPVPDPVIQGLKVAPDGDDRRIASFVQRFGANALAKELTLVRESGSWRIAAEKVVEVK
ncbi:hypothetical protein [Steroidobacter denitrificans]|nr:hypothetical protein [Steroidobacter denitrificans]